MHVGQKRTADHPKDGRRGLESPRLSAGGLRFPRGEPLAARLEGLPPSSTPSLSETICLYFYAVWPTVRRWLSTVMSVTRAQRPPQNISRSWSDHCSTSIRYARSTSS